MSNAITFKKSPAYAGTDYDAFNAEGKRIARVTKNAPYMIPTLDFLWTAQRGFTKASGPTREQAIQNVMTAIANSKH